VLVLVPVLAAASSLVDGLTMRICLLKRANLNGFPALKPCKLNVNTCRCVLMRVDACQANV